MAWMRPTNSVLMFLYCRLFQTEPGGMEVFLFLIVLHQTWGHPYLLKVPNCGLIRATGRILGGVDASINQSPWYVQLTFHKHFCGGFLITPRHVLTAAHCGASFGLVDTGSFVSALRIKVGSSTPSKMAVFRAVAARRHPKYNGEYYHNDIMVIDLGQEIDIRGVRPICLVSKKEKNHAVEGSMAAVFGLGKIAERKNAAQLQVTVQKILPKSQCANHPKLKKHLYDPNLHICAYLSLTRQGRTDACEGDSGGALSVVRKLGDHSFRQFAVGIVSYGFNCAMRNTPGIYTRVSHYQTFILETVRAMQGSEYLYDP